MSDNKDTSLKNSFSGAQSIYVLLPQYHTPDHIAAALGIYHAAKKAGKNTFIASPTPLSSQVGSIPGADRVSDEVGNRNLVISLKLNSTDDIDKVSYHVNEEESTFNLVIQPKASVEPINSDNVNYTYSGAQADMVLMIGANSLQDFAHFYETEKKLFDESTTVNISPVPTANPFATHHYQASDSNSLTKATYQFVKDMGLADLDENSATAFLAGIEIATNNLQDPNTDPDTFELVAKFMKQGGKRGVVQSQSSDNQTPPTQASSNIPNYPAPSSSGGVPNDWLAPKVYKGSSTNPNQNQPSPVQQTPSRV